MRLGATAGALAGPASPPALLPWQAGHPTGPPQLFLWGKAAQAAGFCSGGPDAPQIGWYSQVPPTPTWARRHPVKSSASAAPTKWNQLRKFCLGVPTAPAASHSAASLKQETGRAPRQPAAAPGLQAPSSRAATSQEHRMRSCSRRCTRQRSWSQCPPRSVSQPEGTHKWGQVRPFPVSPGPTRIAGLKPQFLP